MSNGGSTRDELRADVTAGLSIELGRLLDDVAAFLERFVIFTSEHQPRASALWVAHVYAVDAAYTTPYLRVRSAVEECGKSTLLEAFAMLLGERALNAVSVTPSVVFRIRDKLGPRALLLDEVDKTLHARTDDASRDLLAIVNAGYRRGAVVLRNVGQSHEPKAFPAFGPAAIAGTSTLDPTTESRCIPIELERKRPGEGERFLPFLPEVAEPARELRGRLEAWASDDVIAALRLTRPAFPSELRDRHVEGWWQLFAIADLAGGTWPQRARVAARWLHLGVDTADTMSTAALLLAHIRAAFDEADRDRFATAELLGYLVANEQGPWGKWWGAELHRDGPPLAAAADLARKLRPFHIGPRGVRLADGTTPRGYLREQFADAWARYLPPVTGGTATTATAATDLTSPVAAVAAVAVGPDKGEGDDEPGWRRLQREHGEVPPGSDAEALENVQLQLGAVPEPPDGP
jgi:Protein of unknown function (DUF3631)